MKKENGEGGPEARPSPTTVTPRAEPEALQQPHVTGNSLLMANKQQQSAASMTGALKQMEQMMGRNYSEFMRSLASKYNAKE